MMEGTQSFNYNIKSIYTLYDFAIDEQTQPCVREG